MADRPIIFSGPMIRALMEGRKTQTRRLLRTRTEWCASEHLEDLELRGFEAEAQPDGRYLIYRLPFAIGDRLWVRERCQAHEMPSGEDGVLFAADEAWEPIQPTRESADHWLDLYHYGRRRGAQVPSIHMPRWASRLTLIVTDVRVQRLAEISEADAIAEGATMRPKCSGYGNLHDGWSMDWSRVGQPCRWSRDGRILTESDICLGSAVSAFANLINELHDPRWNYKGNGIFGENPWAVAISFTVHRGNIDQMPAHATPSPSREAA